MVQRLSGILISNINLISPISDAISKQTEFHYAYYHTDTQDNSHGINESFDYSESTYPNPIVASWKEQKSDSAVTLVTESLQNIVIAPQLSSSSSEYSLQKFESIGINSGQQKRVVPKRNVREVVPNKLSMMPSDHADQFKVHHINNTDANMELSGFEKKQYPSRLPSAAKVRFQEVTLASATVIKSNAAPISKASTYEYEAFEEISTLQPIQNGESLDDDTGYHLSDIEEGIPPKVNIQMSPCDICGRKFVTDRLVMLSSSCLTKQTRNHIINPQTPQ